VSDAVNIGAEDYLYSENFCFIEWAENIFPILPSNTININIQEIENQKRKITIKF
jgi:tRNA threonylcarbamoyladenosine biosynthesis protein TsaE